VKVKIKSIEKKQWNDKTFYDITIEGDEKGYTCWNDSVQLWKPGQEVEADITEKDTDKGKKLYIKAGSAKGGSRGWQPRDKKEIAINCTTAIVCKMVEKNPTVDTSDTLMAIKFFYDSIYNLIKD